MPRAPKKLYNMPEKIPEGTILSDKQKNDFRVGPSIGIGGFGEVYSASRVGEKSYNYVVKCEPSENGPLFVEINFYMRNAKESDVKAYQKKQGLKSFGMPHFVASGNVTIKEKGHRFLVLPRFGRNIEHFFLANGKRLPVAAVYRLAIQMLDVFEYIHQCGYVHGDLKATNMLLGLGRNGNAQAYLVDYGLAARYHTDKDFKPDPKKAHNGTMEFESRDAHQGVTTMRADLEVLGYNLIYWLGTELPWVRDKLLSTPNKVHSAKINFMNNLESELKKLLNDSEYVHLAQYLKYVQRLQYNEKPDYKKCRKIFQDALKVHKVSETGDLDLEIKKPSKRLAATSPLVTNRAVKPKRAAAAEIETDIAERNASDDDDDDVIFEPKSKKVVKATVLKPIKVRASPTKQAKLVPQKKTLSPVRAKRASPRGAASTKDNSPADKPKQTPPTVSARRGTPLSAQANINFSPKITLNKKPSSLATRNGSTIVNDNVTPNPRGEKTYEFNFELDVSMDANVVVNVKRKKKSPAEEQSNTPKSRTNLSNVTKGTPAKCVKVQKMYEGQSPSGSSPRTPVVKVTKKVKRAV